jgi:hypothetical protein
MMKKPEFPADYEAVEAELNKGVNWPGPRLKTDFTVAETNRH